MFSDDTRKELENIIHGTLIEKQKDSCTTIRNLLCKSFRTSGTSKKDFENKAVDKEKQAAYLKDYSLNNNFWVDSLPSQYQYLTRGGEAEIYLSSDNKTVIKLNDAVYYATWLEYFNNLIIHNLLFNETAYSLIGFTEKDENLCAILQQSYIKATGQAKLTDIKELLVYNGFENTKRNDYYNKSLNILLEDMHDENVIQNSGSLFFIDTVFYIIKNL